MSSNGYNNYPSRSYGLPSSTSTPIGIRGQRVSSFNEVQAIPVDFDGSIFYFPDTANKRIYTKQIGMDGMPIYNVYEKSEVPLDTQSSSFVTRNEFENALNQIKGMIGNMFQQQQINAAPIQQQATPMPQQQTVQPTQGSHNMPTDASQF